ncbi:MAG: ATP-grasp domain-containing protein [Eggerthellaceae bacterium]|nr:ATP-grasp domain-containing protein [Eggerthellaceae bacterium]
MKAIILFPSDYFSLSAPNDNFRSEFDAVIATEGLEATLFNFDDYIEGHPLALTKHAEHLPELVIYRGWMMKPEQYRRFHDDLTSMGFEPLVSPLCYERMHCFPNAGEMFDGQTPRFMAFPEKDGQVSIEADVINETFKRFMIKDYVKSVKNTDFPTFIKTPVTQEELDGYIQDFIQRRGSLFTGGIVLKEYVDLKKYEGATNECRQFVFLQETLGLSRNSSQPQTAPEPPASYLSMLNTAVAPFYTVDYAELADGTWTIIEAGDGQVSGLAESDDPIRFYKAITDRLSCCQ